EIRRLTYAGVDKLLAEGIKALVLACNTATSVAVEDLRADLDIPVIGMEPAIKPAINHTRKGRILVMATTVTLQLPKFEKLVKNLNAEDEIIPLPAPELATLIEEGESRKILKYLKKLLAPYPGRISAVVLGCTHYLFCIDQIRTILPGVPIIHGNNGTVLNLKNILAQNDLLNDSGGSVKLMTSLPESCLKVYERLLTMPYNEGYFDNSIII
ncbi:MAG TPA: aspartate/glutamate racemase family protein, partial [Clostridia bacterium]|nr:aspartate/glutamate racemase family protein [Clostridia bacterium]